MHLELSSPTQTLVKENTSPLVLMKNKKPYLVLDKTGVRKLVYFCHKQEIPLIHVWGSYLDGTCGCGKNTCSSVGKHPKVFRNWQHTPIITKPEEWLETFYKKNREGPVNIGLVTGRPMKQGEGELFDSSGKVKPKYYLECLDFDQKDHPIYQKYSKDSEGRMTFSQKTPRGNHMYFWVKNLPKNRVFREHGMDIRGANGFTVVGPSIHASGEVYSILSLEEILFMPEELQTYLLSLDEKKETKKNPTENVLLPKEGCESLLLDDDSTLSLAQREKVRLLELSKSARITTKRIVEAEEHVESNSGVIKEGHRNNTVFYLLCKHRRVLNTLIRKENTKRKRELSKIEKKKKNYLISKKEAQKQIQAVEASQEKVNVLQEIYVKARELHQKVENPETFPMQEVERILKTITRGKSYDRLEKKYDPVMDRYFTAYKVYQRNNFIVSHLADLFWQGFVPESNSKNFLHMEQIQLVWEKLFTTGGVLYPPWVCTQAMADQLRKKGYSNKRITHNGTQRTLWNCKFSPELLAMVEESVEAEPSRYLSISEDYTCLPNGLLTVSSAELALQCKIHMLKQKRGLYDSLPDFPETSLNNKEEEEEEEEKSEKQCALPIEIPEHLKNLRKMGFEPWYQRCSHVDSRSGRELSQDELFMRNLHALPSLWRSQWNETMPKFMDASHYVHKRTGVVQKVPKKFKSRNHGFLLFFFAAQLQCHGHSIFWGTKKDLDVIKLFNKIGPSPYEIQLKREISSMFHKYNSRMNGNFRKWTNQESDEQQKREDQAKLERKQKRMIKKEYDRWKRTGEYDEIFWKNTLHRLNKKT